MDPGLPGPATGSACRIDQHIIAGCCGLSPRHLLLLLRQLDPGTSMRRRTRIGCNKRQATSARAQGSSVKRQAASAGRVGPQATSGKHKKTLTYINIWDNKILIIRKDNIWMKYTTIAPAGDVYQSLTCATNT